MNGEQAELRWWLERQIVHAGGMRIVMCGCADWLTCEHGWPMMVDPASEYRQALIALGGGEG